MERQGVPLRDPQTEVYLCHQLFGHPSRILMSGPPFTPLRSKSSKAHAVPVHLCDGTCAFWHCWRGVYSDRIFLEVTWHRTSGALKCSVSFFESVSPLFWNLFKKISQKQEPGFLHRIFIADLLIKRKYVKQLNCEMGK